jgi:hypothetical protein
MHLFATTSSEQVLKLGKAAAAVEVEKPAASETPATVARAPQSRPAKSGI